MITFEEVKEMFKESIDATDTMNQALENLMQSIYLKGYGDAISEIEGIKAEIEKQEKWLLQAGYNTYNVDIALDAIKAVVAESEDKECTKKI